jgi:hypothetical protein
MEGETQFSAKARSAVSALTRRMPDESWGAIFLAALPFLLMLLADGLPKLLTESGLLRWEDAGLRILNTGLVVLLAACALAAFLLAWRQRWPAWSATWYLFFCIPLLLLAVGLSSWLTQERFDTTINQEVVLYVWIPLFLAVLLYSVTRSSPLRGLLAALPVVTLLWFPNMEFVPDWMELVVKVPSTALVCLAIFLTLRLGDWRAGVLVILAVNLVVGALYAYAGIYYGGMLPFSAPGPSPLEVARSLVPQYLATSAVLLGPLFAWKIRQVGRAGGQSGKIAYHLALAGLLLVIMANLAGLLRTMQTSLPYNAGSASTSPELALMVGLVAYLLGVIWLYTYRQLPRTVSGWVALILLTLLPLAIPMVLLLTYLSWRWPVTSMYGNPLVWQLPHGVSLSLGVVWLVLSVWVITRGETPDPAALPLQEVTDSRVLNP